MYLDRDEAIKRIRKALKKKTGKSWSVCGGRGTGWGWIDVSAPPRRRINHEELPDADWNAPWRERIKEVAPPEGKTGWYTSQAECKQLAKAFGLTREVNPQGLLISPDDREFYVQRVEV